MTAITPAYVHAYQTICLGMSFPGVPRYSFRLPQLKYRYPILPDDRSQKSLVYDYRGWAICTDGGTSRGEIYVTTQTPDSIGAKLLITTTALRAHRNRNLGTSCNTGRQAEKTDSAFLGYG